MRAGQEADLVSLVEAEDSEWLGLRRTLAEHEHSFVIQSSRDVQRDGHLPAKGPQLHDEVGDQIPGLDAVLAVRPPRGPIQLKFPTSVLFLAVLEPPVLGDHILHGGDDVSRTGDQPQSVVPVEADHEHVLRGLQRPLVLEQETVRGPLHVQVGHLDRR